MAVRTTDRRRRSKRSRQIWRHLRAAMSLLLRRPILSVGVIPVLPDGRIVLVRRVDNDRWSIPGGMMDWGEDIASTAGRELTEETGLDLVGIDRLSGVYSAPERDPRTHSVNVTVVGRVSGDFEIQDPLEVSEIHAFRPDELPFGYLAHDHDQQLRDYLDGRIAVA